jgi:uncharacterized protein (DUF1778 family)
MPQLTGRKRHTKEANLRAQEVLSEKRALLASETPTDDLWNSLQAANSRNKELENLLAEKDRELHRLQ